MITTLRRYFAQRRLKPVVSALPRRLVKAFGPGEHYTFLQAKRAIADLRLSKGLEPYALAAARRLEELEKANVPISAHEYQRLRTELAGLFHLRGTDFTVRNLLETPYSSHHPAQENVYASSGPPPDQ
jgi:hypothetical protein